jgi:hydroxymethylpyrimidine pyrophosphatase-like HAD family hydrolase
VNGARRRAASSARPKLLAVDLDGTLLDSKTGLPHPSDLAALRALDASGVAVSIVTGRLYSGTRPSAEAIGLRGPVACVDGSHIVAALDHATLVHHAVRGETAIAVRDAIVASGAVAFVFARDAITHDARGAEYVSYVALWSSYIRVASSIADHPLWQDEDGVTAVVAVGSQGEVANAVATLEKTCGDAVQVASFALRRMPGRWGMIVRAARGTKGSALTWLATHHGFDIAETVCVGDWYNDAPMLAIAGRSFAMAQAPDEVKRLATDLLVESAETGGGIARVVRDVFGVEAHGGIAEDGRER